MHPTRTPSNLHYVTWFVSVCVRLVSISRGHYFLKSNQLVSVLRIPLVAVTYWSSFHTPGKSGSDSEGGVPHLLTVLGFAAPPQPLLRTRTFAASRLVSSRLVSPCLALSRLDSGAGKLVDSLARSLAGWLAGGLHTEEMV